ncbi:MAG: cytochrome c [Verrucomicrobia bacterium]|nr:cytochrome c [Verrucomicrobiota bacterium]
MRRSRFLLLLFSLISCVSMEAREKIDSSAEMEIKKYPSSMHKNYALFQEKCSQCHSLSAAMKSDDVLPSYWQKTVAKMQKKSGSHISAEEAQQIYDFLVYDSSQRRKQDFDDQLSSLPPDKQKKEKDALDQVKSKY